MCQHHAPHKQLFILSYKQFMLNFHAFHKTVKAMKFSSLKLFTYSYIQYCSNLSILSNYFVHIANIAIKFKYRKNCIMYFIAAVYMQLQAIFCWDTPTILSLKIHTKGTQLIIFTSTWTRPRYRFSDIV